MSLGHPYAVYGQVPSPAHAAPGLGAVVGHSTACGLQGPVPEQDGGPDGEPARPPHAAPTAIVAPTVITMNEGRNPRRRCMLGASARRAPAGDMGTMARIVRRRCATVGRAGKRCHGPATRSTFDARSV